MKVFEQLENKNQNTQECMKKSENSIASVAKPQGGSILCRTAAGNLPSKKPGATHCPGQPLSPKPTLGWGFFAETMIGCVKHGGKMLEEVRN